MKVSEELIKACYRHLVSKNFRVDKDGITFSMSKEDQALLRGAGEKQVKRALKCALARLALVEASNEQR